MKKSILFLSSIFLLTAVLKSQINYKELQKVSSFDDIDYPYETKKQPLSNGIEIAYMDEGQGEKTILFIHGLGSYAPAWKKNIETLKANFRCIAVDLPGYGKSSKGSYSGKMSFFADQLKSFLDSLNLDKVSLAGHSMGGQISTVFALKYPEYVDQLILIAPAGVETFSEGEKDWLRNALSAKAILFTPLHAIESNLGSNFYKMPEDAFFMAIDRYAITGCGEDFYWYCNIIPKCVNGMVDEPVVRDFKKLSMKTLVVFGEADQLIPNRFLHGGPTRKIAEKAAQLIPNSQAEVIPKAGHFVMFEKSEEVNNLIVDFLK